MKEAYERALDALRNDRLNYVYFDFHHECKGLRFDRVDGLIDGLDEELQKQSLVPPLPLSSLRLIFSSQVTD